MTDPLGPRKARGPFFKPRPDVGPAHISRILHAVLIARASVADAEARALLEDIAEDAARVVALCKKRPAP